MTATAQEIIDAATAAHDEQIDGADLARKVR